MNNGGGNVSVLRLFYNTYYKITSDNQRKNEWNHILTYTGQEMPYISQSFKNEVQLGVSVIQ